MARIMDQTALVLKDMRPPMRVGITLQKNVSNIIPVVCIPIRGVITARQRERRYTMIRLLILLSALFSTSAFAQISQFCNSDRTSGTVYGKSPNSIEEYLDSRRNTGTIFNNPEAGISQYYFNGPSGMRQDSGTILNTPMGNTPMGMPQSVPEIEQIAPMQPWTPSMPAGRGRR